MKLLHTSDWHLGRSLYGRKRYTEFFAFLDWLTHTIQEEQVDVLLVSGDVFDTSTPSNRAQELYYQFLCRVSASCCRHVIVIGGNHDSPSFLNAPKDLLCAMHIHVVGSVTENIEDELIFLFDDSGIPQAIVCAVPYLRDKDIRFVEPGETIDDKNAKLVEGLKKHYTAICSLAEQKQKEFKKAGHTDVPIIGMGHLFTAGGKTVDGDGVRELYVGSLTHVGADVFPSSIDYLALGHLHVPQVVGRQAHIRYSGSPIPIGFGEARQKKQVLIVEFDKTTPHVHPVPIPCFQQLVRISDSLDGVLSTLKQLKKEKSSAWLEIEYTGSEMIANLREIFDDAVAGSAMEIRRIKNTCVTNLIIHTISEDQTLDSLDTIDVFERCLDAFDVPDTDRETLTASYKEILTILQEDDVNAE
jgi:exonuclease SbcD